MSYHLSATSFYFHQGRHMPQKIKIVIGQAVLQAELFDTPCARAIVSSLPIETRPSEWGDEFYFQIPVNIPLDDSATTGVKVGDIGYWPPGQALALFFGPTPMSTGSEPVPASEVNLVGRILDDPRLLRKEKGTPKIRIEQG
jgi:uncharacterized protein